MDTIYQYRIWQTPEDGDVAESDSHLLPFDCFVINLHFDHVLQLSYPQHLQIPLSSFRRSILVPRAAFLAGGSSIIHAILSETGASGDFMDVAVPDVLLFASRMVGDPLNSGRRILPLTVALFVASPYDDRDEIDRAIREAAQEASTISDSESFTGHLEKVKIEKAKCLVGECSVCLKELSNGSEVTLTPCSHLYHRDCLLRWLEKKKSCPLCRSRVSS